MHHEEEERHHERPRRRHPRHEEEQQNFRSRWEEPRPFMHDRDRRFHEEEMRARAQHEAHHRNQQHGRQHPDDINRRQHGFSDDHPSHMEERREWRRDGNNFYNPENQHARDRWQQHEQLPPLREQRRRHQSRREEDRDERGW